MAMIRSLEISYGGNVSHYRPDGSLCFTIGNEFGFNFNAENVTNMSHMFYNCYALLEIDFSSITSGI